MTGRVAVLSAVFALIFSCVLQAAPSPSRASLKYRDFDDLVRCRFITEEVCSRLLAADSQGASAFLGVPGEEDFRDLPDNIGRIISCRRVKPASGSGRRASSSDMTLLLGYDSGYTQEVGLSFAVLEGRACGYIAALAPDPARIVKDGKTYLRFYVSWRVDGEDSVGESVSDIVLRVRPEKEEAPRPVTPREVYIGKVLEQVRAERQRREAEKDPLNRPLIQKE